MNLFAFKPLLFIAACTKSNVLFFLPVWYKYLTLTPDAGGCSVNINGINDIWLIGLAILDILLRLAGFLAVISIIVAGVSYMTAAGNAEKTTAARKRIVNSLVGLIIAMTAAGLVAFIGNSVAK